MKEMRVLASEGRPQPSFLGVLEEKLKGAVGPEASKATASGSRRRSERTLPGVTAAERRPQGKHVMLWGGLSWLCWRKGGALLP